ncbi:hypothetical protein QFC21_005770 [Naganishia friedmannii]|uniref:Uncharacterized protein n=1 Tax=Naganishia friedmannii TaxID=89922 RepID=A0ACC2V7P1_9TREE|nr:hypothetical protein QFC21_005770 [Naganishia friedmannii]
MSQSRSGSSSSRSLLPVTADRTTVAEYANVPVASSTFEAPRGDFYSLLPSQLPPVPAASGNPSYSQSQGTSNLLQWPTERSQQRYIAVNNSRTGDDSTLVIPETPAGTRYGPGNGSQAQHSSVQPQPSEPDLSGSAHSPNQYRERAVLAGKFPTDPVAIIEAIIREHPTGMNDELAKHDIITNLNELISYLQSGKKLEKSTVDGMVECLASAIRESSIKPNIRFKSVGAVA